MNLMPNGTARNKLEAKTGSFLPSESPALTCQAGASIVNPGLMPVMNMWGLD